MPAFAGMLISLLLPTVQTVLISLESGGALTPSTFVGLENYGQVLGSRSPFWPALGFSLSLVLMPLLVALVVGPPLALALDRAGGRIRRAGRVVLSLSLIVFSPTAVAASWLRGLRPEESGLVTVSRALGDPATAPGALRLIVAAATFGLVCALAVMAFLPALRGESPGLAVLAVGGVVVLAMLAAGLQTFSTGLAMTRGGPVGSTRTLAGLQYDFAFVTARPGMGAVVATVMGLALGVLGVAATIIVVAGSMRVSLLPGDPRPVETPGGATARRASPGGVVAGLLALVAVAAITLFLTWPWLSALLEPSTPSGAGLSVAGPRTQVNTWGPALIGAVISVGTAYLAALGIGGLRPLGRRSEWLLLPFAPWLFVGVGPVSVAGWSNLRGMRLIDTFVALVQPFLVSVPALLIMTLLCKGLAERSGGDFLGGVVRPSLPMAGVLAGAVTLVNAQDLLWPLLVVHDRAMVTAPVAQLLQVGQFGRVVADVGLTTPPAVVVIALAAVVAAQLLYLDRLAVTVGGRRDSPIPALPA